MSRLILWETDYLISCFLLGIFLAVLYDIVRIIRIVLPHPMFAVGAEDTVYWLFTAAAVFLRLYHGNDGIIRWYAIAAAAASMLLYNRLVSRFFVPVIGRLLRAPIDFLGRVLKRTGKRVKIKLNKIKLRKSRKAGKRRFHGRKKTEKKEA